MSRGENENKMKVQRIMTLSGHEGPVRGVIVTRDGRFALSGGADGSLRIWDLEIGAASSALTTDVAHYALATFPQTYFAVSGTVTGQLALWNLETGENVRCIDGHEGPVVSAAITPDGRQIISGDGDRTLKIWDSTLGTLVHTYERLQPAIGHLTVTPDGRQVLAVEEGQTLKAWDLASGANVVHYRGHEGDIVGVRIIAKGERVLSAAVNGVLIIWDRITGEALRTIQTGLKLHALAATPNERLAVVAAQYPHLSVWDLEAGRELGTLPELHTRVNGIAITRDGRRIIAACEDASVQVWKLVN